MRKRRKKSSNDYIAFLKTEVIKRDHGCVFCYLEYRPEEHIPIPDYDFHLYRGKAFACCAYHAMFLNRANPVYLPKRKEMLNILDEYLADKDDPKMI